MKIFSLAFLWYIPVISGLLFAVFASPVFPDSHAAQKTEKTGSAKIVFKNSLP